MVGTAAAALLGSALHGAAAATERPAQDAFAAAAAAMRPPAEGQARNRIAATAVDDNDRVTLSGHARVRADAANDRGQADDEAVVERMIITLNPDAAQQAALDAFIASRNNPASPWYRQWLTPAEYERQFGVSAPDMAAVVVWLKQQGFTVDAIPTGRRSIVFSGRVKHIRQAFRTEVRRVRAGDREVLANLSDPSIPDALSAVVNGVISLSGVRSRPQSVNVRPAPQFSSGSTHALAPADFHTIYNVKPLLAQGTDGTGRSIAVLGRSNIVMADMTTFRSVMGLPANPPQVIITGADPGRQSGDEGESDLDLQWAGAVAPGATIKFVTSASTASTDGIDLSAQYAVSNNVADVISLSYGLCEADLGTAATNFYNSLWQQAAAQGQTVLVSSGDSGAAGCEAASASTSTRGKAVNGLCTSPYATCVGGTQFNDTASPATWWASSNTSGTLGSALSYIPEVVWNESGAVSGGSGLWASGGGASAVFAKPSWQTGLGVPNDGRRNVPDVSLAAASHDGYLVYSSDNATSASTRYIFGGTSASAPAFAGLMALVNHATGARQGVANPRFYQLAALQASGGPGYFHAITGGNNSVPGVTGFAATAGTTLPVYNQATGLGSVDASVLVGQWDGVLLASSTTLTPNVASSVYAQTVTLTANVVVGGTTAPTGTVQFNDGSTPIGAPVAVASDGSATLSTAALSSGSHSLVAVYSGDSTHSASVSAAVTLQVAPVSTAVSVQADVASSTLGQTVTFTASITGKSVSGSLQVLDGNTVLATVPIVSCPAVFRTNLLAVGAHAIRVVYLGDANNSASTSAAVTHTVAPLMVSSQTTLSSGAASAVVGDTVVFTAQVQGALPTGSVQFLDGSTPLGTATLSASGVASFSTSALAVGSHSITAVYAGDAYNVASVSPTWVQAITPATVTAVDADAPLPGWAVLLAALGLFASVVRQRRGLERA